MKVLNLRCANGHGFDGWFGSEDDYVKQNGGGLIECPLCSDRVVTRLPSAPRLNLSGARAPVVASTAPTVPASAAVPAEVHANVQTDVQTNGQTLAKTNAQTSVHTTVHADMQAAWLHAVRHVIANTEDVGARFAEEARRIHYGETKGRAIRGAATPEERQALLEEGIEVMALPIPRVLEGPLQ